MILMWKRLLTGMFVVRMIRKRRQRKHAEGQTTETRAAQDKPRS